MSLNIQQLIQKGREVLVKVDIPEIESRFIAEYVLNMTFTELVSNYNREVTKEEETRFMTMISKRQRRYPLQYITNEQMFYGIKFYVNEHVLIPRPETEMLVDLGIDYVKKLIEQGQKEIRILDMCTGSGCIAISIANEFQGIEDINIRILGVDISDEALIVSNRNLNKLMEDQRLSCHVEFVQSDLFQQVKEYENDLIISNPPYISPVEIETLMPEVKEHEPVLALDGGGDGLKFYREIAEKSMDYLKGGGMVLFEIGHGQMDDVKNILLLNNYKGVNGQMDLQQYERIVYGIKLNKPD